MNNLSRDKCSFSLFNVNILQARSLDIPNIDCSKIRVFCLKDVVILGTVLRTFIEKLTALESIEISNLQLIHTENLEPTARIMCKYVKNINFEFSSWEIFDFLYTPNIMNLRLVSQNLHAHRSIVLFLSEVNNLKDLELHAVSCDIMEFFEFINYSFGLRKLTLISSEYRGFINTNHDQNFLNFMKEHIKSLNTLEMRALVSPECLDFLIKKLRRLKWLLLKVNYLINNAQLYFKKNPKKSVKNLILEGPFQGLEMIASILTLYPSIQFLHLRDLYMDFNLNFFGKALFYASSICTEIIDLNISRMPSAQFEICFKKLETLRIGYVNDWMDLISFLKKNWNVHTLVIDYIFRQQTDIRCLEMLLTCNILHLRLTSDAHEIKKIFEFIETIGSGNLLTLELTIQSYESKTYIFNYSPGNTNILTSEFLQNDINASIIDDLVGYLE